MIEIIREENSGTTERRSLPKDIKQMGKPDIGERIYVENAVYQFLHPYSNIQEKSAYVLLGRFENYSGRDCVFVEAAILLEEIAFEGELPIWNDETWAYIYRQLRQEYDSMVIVGWAMDIKGQLPNMTLRLEQLHQSHFGGAHQILFLMDSLEREEAFYGNRSGHLYRREGFYVYYDKRGVNAARKKENSVVPELKEERETGWDWRAAEESGDLDNAQRGENEAQEFASGRQKIEETIRQRTGAYRNHLAEKQQKRTPSYASTAVLAAVVCTLGITAYLNGEKMRSMEATLAQMHQTPPAETQTEEKEADVAVEEVAGNVHKQEEPVVQNPPTEQTVTAATDGTTPAEGQTPPVAVPPAEPAPPADGAQPPAQNPPEVPPAGNTAENPQNAGDTQGQTAAPPVTEAQAYLNQGYYIVQKGDSLVGICRKVYQTTAMMDQLCAANGIENADEIYAGQKLTLPN